MIRRISLAASLLAISVSGYCNPGIIEVLNPINRLKDLFDDDDDEESSIVNPDTFMELTLTIAQVPGVGPLFTLIKANRRPDDSQAREMLNSLSGDPEKALPVLYAALENHNWTVREAAATAIGNFGVRAEGSVERLNEVVHNDERTEVQRAAFDAVDKIGDAVRVGPYGVVITQQSPQGAIALILLIRDTDPAVRASAATLLGEMGERAQLGTYSAELVDAFDVYAKMDPDEAVRMAFRKAAGKVRMARVFNRPEQDLLTIRERLVKGLPDERARIATAIGHMGSQFKLGDGYRESLRTLADLLQDGDSDVVAAAEAALRRISATQHRDPTIEVLVAGLDAEHGAACAKACAILADAGRMAYSLRDIAER